MTAEQQNENWLRMASDSRKEVRRIYSLDHNGREFDKGFEYAIETIFGKHNLTSDIEPKEMLLVERKRVNEIYSEAEMNNKYYSQPNCNERERIIKVYFGGQMVALKQLFGDKCLNEKETLFSENHKNENKENGIVDKENMSKISEIFTKENLDEIVSSMLEYTAILTKDIINEAQKYKPEEERIFIKGAAWMLYHLVKNRGQRHTYIESDMSLDEAIEHCEKVLPLAETSQCAREHIQLRDWLIELKQYREKKQ